jgi:hypothetical protein
MSASEAPDGFADGSRLAALFHRAQTDPDLRVRVYYCPESVTQDSDLTEPEKRALRTGDLSRVKLDDESFELGRRLFDELPIEQVKPFADKSYDVQGEARRKELCI